MSFVHLHTHSYYSLLDGLGSLEAIIERVKQQGAPAIGLTDHGVLYGAIDFYKLAKAAGIKPIIGCEMYVAPRTRFDKEANIDNKPYHLTVLARSYEGYQNLLQLVTKSHLEGFYYKPRVDEGLLKVYSKDLIGLSGCLVSETSRSILEKDDEDTLRIIGKYQEIFGKENFFLELQDHPLIEKQDVVNKKLVEFSKKIGAPLVATCDAHYVDKDDAEAHDILLCIQTQTHVTEEDRMRMTGDFSLRSPEEMKRVFADVPEAVTNTLAIAERCNIELPFDLNLLPRFHTPNNELPHLYLRILAEEGLRQRFGENPPQNIIDRLNYELKIVHEMGFDAYFLIVHDFVKFAKDRKILVGPGRGSAAGSILSYALRITEINPLRYGLLFERFLNPERISMPDIDIDFADDRRQEVLDYVIEKYSRENVAQIITYGTMAARAAVRDVGRALGYPYAEVDTVAKSVPPPVQGKHIPLTKSIRSDPELRSKYESDARTKKLLDMAIKLEGTVRHAGTHACAVVISPEPLVKYTPLQYTTGGESREIITQYSMKPIEQIGLLKMDFLGLKNLTILEQALDIIERVYEKKMDLASIPLDDPKTFELLKHGDTTGVFQLESAGMRRYLRNLQPTCFEDIIAMVALYRPGPMDWIPQYINGKRNADSVRYFDKTLEPILRETYGVAVYQEQILQIAQVFSGFTLGEADILRKAVGKKIPKLLTEQREKFIEGAVKKKHSRKFAEEVFEKVIEPFAGYGFNKAHATSYAMIAYQTAYLKANYPAAFMTALMSSDQADMDKVAFEIQECEIMGISVLPPSINESDLQFTLIDDHTIRFGLLVIKGVGKASIQEILEIRKKSGPFHSLRQLVERVPYRLVNKKLFEALAYSGGLDELGERRSLVENFEHIVDYAKDFQNSQAHGQTDLFGMLGEEEARQTPSFHMKKVEPASLMDRLRWEKAFLGLYVTAHPLQGLKKYFAKKVVLLEKLNKKDIGKNLKCGGIVLNPRKIMTKNGVYMCSFILEDPTGRIDIVLFPKVYTKCAEMVKEDQIVILEGKLEFRRGELGIMCNTLKTVSLDRMIENAQMEGFYNEQERVPKNIRKISFDSPENSGHEEFDADHVDENSHEHEFDDHGTFVIHIPANISSTTLQEIKTVLEGSKGKQTVELHFGQTARKRMKIPFGVKIDEQLKGALEKMLEAKK